MGKGFELQMAKGTLIAVQGIPLRYTLEQVEQQETAEESIGSGQQHNRGLSRQALRWCSARPSSQLLCRNEAVQVQVCGFDHPTSLWVLPMDALEGQFFLTLAIEQSLHLWIRCLSS